MELSTGDQNIVRNLRHRWREELKAYSDEQLAQEYREFGRSDMYGDNDALFLEWMEGIVPKD